MAQKEPLLQQKMERKLGQQEKVAVGCGVLLLRCFYWDFLTSPIELPPDSQVMPSSESFEDFRQLHGEMLDSEDYSTPGNDPWLPMQADFSPDPYFHPSASEIAFLTDPNIELDTTVYPENWLSPMVPQMDTWLPTTCDFSILDEEIRNLTDDAC
jgi:hypothetical protein